MARAVPRRLPRSQPTHARRAIGGKRRYADTSPLGREEEEAAQLRWWMALPVCRLSSCILASLLKRGPAVHHQLKSAPSLYQQRPATPAGLVPSLQLHGHDVGTAASGGAWSKLATALFEQLS